jgi:hypothetical protein
MAAWTTHAPENTHSLEPLRPSIKRREKENRKGQLGIAALSFFSASRSWQSCNRADSIELKLRQACREFVEMSLTRDSAKHIVSRNEKVETGNLAERALSASGRRMSLDDQEA